MSKQRVVLVENDAENDRNADSLDGADVPASIDTIKISKNVNKTIVAAALEPEKNQGISMGDIAICWDKTNKEWRPPPSMEVQCALMDALNDIILQM